RDSSAQLRAGLEALSAELGMGEVRGHGLLLALDVKYPIAEEAVAEARLQQLLLNAPRPNLLRFMPALTLSGHEIQLMLGRLQLILRSLMAQYQKKPQPNLA
ncbi:MAG: aminotransferase class III-fold pyridoxal phosphate-dependent enzyme, partial [Plesiomonas sp.]